MALRSEYSLGHSEYNAFLFAAVGEEKIGMPLTVLTALTRLGIDPWQEAARLADLSKEAALRTLAATIAKLPEGDWKAADSEAIAARLLSWLPGRSTKAVPQVAVKRSLADSVKLGFAPWLVWEKDVVCPPRLMWVPPCRKQLERDGDYPARQRERLHSGCGCHPVPRSCADL